MPYLLTRNRQQSFAARIRIPPGPAVVGRSDRATIQIDDRSVSKIHATIECLPDGRFRIEDMGSRNGVFLDGQRRKRLEVGVGAEVRLGDVTITFCGDGPETMPIPDPVPRPTPEDYETSLEETRRLAARKEQRQHAASSGKGGFLWSVSEQWTLVLFGTVALLLGASVAWFSREPEPDDATAPAVTDAGGAKSQTATESRADTVATPPLDPRQQLLQIAPDRVRELRRIWLLAFGRIATIEETVTAAEQSIDEILAAAMEREEFWRWRAWSRAGAEVWSNEQLLKVPHDAAAWSAQLREVGKKTARQEAAPLPRQDGDDGAYRGWLIQQVENAQRPLAPAEFVRSVWIASEQRRAIDVDIDRQLLAAPEVLLEPAGPRAIVRLLVYAAGSELPQRRVDITWMQATVQWLLGRKLPAVEAEALVDLVGNNPRAIIEECLLSSLTPPKDQRDPLATPGEGQIRIEAWCDFPVRPILQAPKTIPRLWSRFASADVRIYPQDAVPVEQLRVGSLPSQVRDGDVWVVDRAPTSAVSLFDVRLVDGVLTPALRSVADLCGNPTVPAVAEKEREVLRERLRLRPLSDATPRWATWRERLRLGGYRLVSDNAAGAIHDPAARGVLAALAELDADRARAATASTVISVSVSQPPGHDERTWEDFMAALELLSVRYPDLTYDLWLWGTVNDGAGHRAVRLTWGPGVDRGRVLHETLTARRQHPLLRAWRPESKGPEAEEGRQ